MMPYSLVTTIPKPTKGKPTVSTAPDFGYTKKEDLFNGQSENNVTATLAVLTVPYFSKQICRLCNKCLPIEDNLAVIQNNTAPCIIMGAAKNLEEIL